jgi:putative spermidine/putrescine transport system substrate-binding protein
MRKSTIAVFFAAFVSMAGPARAADVICYNCPPQWADFATMLKAIKADLGYDSPYPFFDGKGDLI